MVINDLLLEPWRIQDPKFYHYDNRDSKLDHRQYFTFSISYLEHKATIISAVCGNNSELYFILFNRNSKIGSIFSNQMAQL